MYSKFSILSLKDAMLHMFPIAYSLELISSLEQLLRINSSTNLQGGHKTDIFLHKLYIRRECAAKRNRAHEL